MKTVHFVRAVLLTMSIVFAVTAQPAFAARIMVCVGRGKVASPPRDMRLYSIEARCFAQDAGFAGFPEALQDARLLFIRLKSRYALEALIDEEANRQAIRSLLARGGVMWIERATMGGKPIAEFMKTLGVETPPDAAGEGGSYVANPKSKNPILSNPSRQRNSVRGWQYWTNWPESLEPLMVGKDEPGRCALLLASNVQGNGMIFFTTTSSAWDADHNAMDALIENVLFLAFGPLPAPGETHPVYDSYRLREPATNTAHLTDAGKAEWHVPDAARRKIFLVSEPIGMLRRSAYVEVECEVGGNETVRAFTASAAELHAQALGGNRVAVSVPLRKYDDLPVYVYIGGNEPAAVQDFGPFTLEKIPEGWLMRNGLFEAVTAGKRPSLQRIRPHGGGNNMLCTWGNAERWLGNGTDFMIDRKGDYATPKSVEVTVVADGPVIKTLRYTVQVEGRNRVVDISLVRGGSALFYKLLSDTAESIKTRTGWQPGPSHTDDSYWYEAVDGLKQLPLVTRPATSFSYGEHHKEPWYAIVDEAANEACGGFSQWVGSFYCHMIFGHLIMQTYELTPAGTTGGWVASKGDAHAVRNAYIAWRNPPVVTEGKRQKRQDVPAAERPAFGRDFIRMHGSFRRYYPRNDLLDLDPWAEIAVSTVREMAGNVGQMGNHTMMEDYDPFVTALHKHGLAAGLKVYARRLGCSVKNREKYLEATRVEAGHEEADIYYLLDEFAHQDTCETCQADFKRRTGLALPLKLDLSKLPDEATYQAVLWRRDVLTELVREMNAIVKKHHPHALTFVVTSPEQMGWEAGTFNDLETWSGIIGTVSADLYSRDYSAVRFGMQYLRGARGNTRPVLTVHGGTLTSQGLYVNLGAHLMNGANGLWFFASVWQRFGRNIHERLQREYELMRDSGYENLLARAHPVRYAAVLCERNSFFESIRRGELNRHRALYHVYVEKQASLRNVPTDIVFASHLAKDLPNYKVLLVPSGRNMSTQSANTIADWVRQGGKVIVEGEALLTPALARLCGVSAQDVPKEFQEDIEGNAQPLTGLSVSANTRVLPLTVKDATVLADAGGSPVVTARSVENGKAVAVALGEVPHSLLRPLVLDLGGRMPLEVDVESSPDVRAAALTDGSRTAIGVFNEHFSDTKTVTITLGGIAPRARRMATNIHKGTRQEVTDTLAVELPCKTWNFFLLENAASSMSLAAPGTFIAADVYCAKPEMSFLKLAAKKKVSKRKREPGVVYAAVYKNPAPEKKGPDFGGEAIMSKLRTQKKVVAEWVDDLAPGTISFYDVIVVPNMYRRDPGLGPNWQENVRQFVLEGGGALLVHHSAGFGDTASPPFAEVATVDSYAAVRGMEVVADHPVVNAAAIEKAFPGDVENPAFAAEITRHKLSVGSTFNSGFPDYMRLVPGKAGTVVVKSLRVGNLGGDPAVVVGTVGRGRVVLSGMDIGAKCEKVDGKYVTEELLAPEEEAILVNSVFWLAQ